MDYVQQCHEELTAIRLFVTQAARRLLTEPLNSEAVQELAAFLKAEENAREKLKAAVQEFSRRD